MNKTILMTLIITMTFLVGFTSQEASAESILYGIGFPGSIQFGGGGDSTLYTIDITDGAPTVVGTITGFGFCEALEVAADGTLYATCARTSDNVGVLITIDPSTGTGTEVGPTGFVVIDGISFPGVAQGLSFRNSDGALYGYHWNCSDDPPFGLMTIDVNSGTATGIEPSGLCVAGNGLAFSPDDTLYHHANGQLETLDPATGAPLGFIGSSTTKVNAMDFDPSDGTLYGTIPAGKTIRNLATIDPSNGIIVIKGQIDARVSAIAFHIITPEENIEELILEVEDLGLTNGSIKSLTKKLDGAFKNFTNEDLTDDLEGCEKLQSFIDQLNAFVNSGKLTQEEIDPLVELTQVVIAGLCTG